MKLTGRWKGTKQLYFKPGDTPFESGSILEVNPVAKESFIQATYTWSYKDRDHEGILLLCTNGVNNTVTAAWGDSFHQSGCLMHLEGHMDEEGTLDVMGTYAAPPGPDWGVADYDTG